MHVVHRVACAAALLLAVIRLGAEDSPLAWAIAVRGPSLPGLRPSPELAAAASAYAAELAAAGVLSHAGPADASRPLDRFLRAGGTAFEVGEILGAGPDLEAIERAWVASPPHLAVVRSARYTDVGWGSARAGSQIVWVLMFCRTAIADLTLEERDGMLLVRGRLSPAWAAQPWLDAGSGPALPKSWDPASRRFVYRVPLVDGRARVLLGCRDRYGDRQATDSVTWPRGTGFPAGAGRSAAPAPPP